MSTRHVQPGERRTPHGYASSPEYDCLRGLQGTALSLKAAIQFDPAHCELLYSLLTLSQRVGGVERIAKELLEMFPERIKTVGPFARHGQYGQRITRTQAENLDWQLRNSEAAQIFAPHLYPNCTESLIARADDDPEKELSTFVKASNAARAELITDKEAQVLWARIKEVAQAKLPALIEELCYNPKVAMDTAAPCFHDLLGALLEYRRRYIQTARANYVETSISATVVKGLDYALRRQTPVLIEGDSGFGKTEGVESWIQAHLGQVILLRMTAGTQLGGFIKMLAEKCGLARSNNVSAGKVKLNVEAFFKRTNLLLVLDEAQYIWPSGSRVRSHPDIVSWLLTALFNEGVPYVMVATKQFSERCSVIADQTGYNMTQLDRRTRKIPLPDRPTAADLELVARKLLEGAGITAAAAVDEVVGYAQESGGYFQTIADAIGDARMIAEDAGRECVTYKDLVKAIDEFRVPSDAAKKPMFEQSPRKRGQRSNPPLAAPLASIEADVQDSLTTRSQPVNMRGMKPATCENGQHALV